MTAAAYLVGEQARYNPAYSGSSKPLDRFPQTHMGAKLQGLVLIRTIYMGMQVTGNAELLKESSATQLAPK